MSEEEEEGPPSLDPAAGVDDMIRNRFRSANRIDQANFSAVGIIVSPVDGDFIDDE